jgi:SAM-dependent methyltransferase
MGLRALIVTVSEAEPSLEFHAARIRANPFLYAIYCDMYRRLLAEVPADSFPRLLEIGSGAGFLRELAPHLTTSDCIAGPGIDRVVDACNLEASFEPDSWDGIVAFDVFHHLPNVEAFLSGAARVLRPGGRIALVEPWFTPLGQWFYRLLHHEPSILDPNDWSLRGEGRLGGANSRLPTSVFRDGVSRLARVAPEMTVAKTQPFHKWLYLLSGGLRFNTRVPRFVGEFFLWCDRKTAALDTSAGIFALIVVERVPLATR